MLEQFFNSPSQIQSLRDGPGGPLIEKFAKELCRGGYSKITARKRIRAAAHFLCWGELEGIPISILSQKFIERFERHLDQCQCPGYSNRDRRQIVLDLADIVIISTRPEVVATLEFVLRGGSDHPGQSGRLIVGQGCPVRLAVRGLRHVTRAPSWPASR